MYKQLTKILESKEDKVEVKMQTEKVSNTNTSPCILKKRKRVSTNANHKDFRKYNNKVKSQPNKLFDSDDE